jgi:hypothetical protein
VYNPLDPRVERVMKYLTAVTFVLVCTLACTGGAPSAADVECALPDNANQCEACLYAACEQSCRTCVEDAECFGCTKSDEPDSDCMTDPEVAQLIGCIVGNCTTECMAEEPRNPRQRIGRPRRGGPGGGGGDRPGPGDGGGREGKTGKRRPGGN